MKLTEEQIAQIKRHDEKTIAALYTTLRRCARAGIRKAGLDEGYADDVMQETLLVFINSLIHRYDQAYNLEPILIATAMRIGLDYKKNRRLRLLSDGEEFVERLDREEGIVARNNGEGPASYDSTPDLIENLDKERALRYISNNCTFNNDGKLDSDKGNGADRSLIKQRTAKTKRHPKSDRKKRTKEQGKTMLTRIRDDDLAKSAYTTINPERGARPLVEGQTGDAKRLRDIRQNLAITQKEMADKLEDILGKGMMKMPRYLSYEYGKVKTIPAEVMEAAEKIQAGFDGLQEWREKFDNKSMPDIAQEWAKRMGAEAGNVTEMSDLLQVNKSTYSRWLNDNARPNIFALKEYDHTVTRQVEMNERLGVKNVSAWRNQYQTGTPTQIIENFAKRLRASTSDRDTLSELLSVSRDRLERWMDDGERPSTYSLMAMEARVAVVEKLFQNAMATA